MRTFKYFAAVTLLTLVSGLAAHAAEIVKIKGGSALIDLKGDSVNPGDQFYAVGGDGKKRAIVQISKIVKGDKAIGHITKGKADVGMTLEPKGGASGSASADSRKSRGTKGKMFWGGMVGYAMDTANVKVLWQSTVAGQHTAGDTKEVAGLSGTGYSAMGLFDYSFTPNFWVRALAGIESFNVSGPSSCGAGNNTTCDSKITYLSGSAVARWLFLTDNVRPWLGAGVGIMFPATKSSTAFDSSSISSTQVILVQGGVDWSISPKMYIPVSIEYGLLPKSTQVDAHWIELRAGVAVPF